MVINHHISSQLAGQHAAELRRQVAASSAKPACEPRSTRRRSFRRPAHTVLVAVKETTR